MPQMSPIYWLILMMYFVMMMMLLIMIIFFFYMPFSSMKISLMTINNSMNWMW